MEHQSAIAIYIIGAGGIVNDAHLPAYAIAGYSVKGIYDLDKGRARATATRFNIPFVADDINELVKAATGRTIFDIAVPGDKLLDVLKQLPDAAMLLMQKPMGNDLANAREILQLVRAKKMVAAVNFQLRYAPFVTAARKMISGGSIGELCDVEINVNVFMPWKLWPFLFGARRVEILYHSIHYIDLVRSLLGNPQSIYAKTIKHPAMMELASVKSTIIMDYGDVLRAGILTNHCHVYGPRHQQSYIKLEGTKGAIKINMGALLNYPTGGEDVFEYIILEEGVLPEWKTLPIKGSWFPHAFIGSMQELMDVANGIKDVPGNSVEDCIHTMDWVEAAYHSNETGMAMKGEL